MCGILGCYLKRPLSQEDVVRLRQARDMLAHRGPDASGEFVDVEKGIYLGHRRLRIIDLSEESAQPMSRAGHILCYNGEIYNFPELRDSLRAAGAKATSAGDTEVLLLSWMQWAEKALDRLDGMFAFALYDGKRLHLVTDPFGEKPLYLLRHPDGVYFASEPAPLRALHKFDFQPTEEDSAAFLCLGFVPAPRTGFVNLEVLPPASHIAIAAGQVTLERRYWMPDRPNIGRGPVKPIEEADIDAVEDALVRSLQRRLISDVPVGLFLSGGVDSALVAAILAKKLQYDIRTITVAFPDGADESTSAQSIARHLGLDHQIVDSGQDESWRDLPGELLSLYGDANDNTTAIAVRQMCHAAREHMVVSLSGTGGDELFFGYQKYAFLYDKRHLNRWLGPIVDILRPLLSNGVDIFRPWALAKDQLSASPGWQFLAIKNAGAIGWLRQLPGTRGIARRFTADGEGLTALRARMFDLTQTMPMSYIPAIERGSMRASLEVRTPYLSRDLYASIARIDQRSLIGFGRKQLAYRLLARYLPRDLYSSSKQGFVMPISRYLANAGVKAPIPPNLGDAAPQAVWNARSRAGMDRVALRLKILETMGGTDPIPVLQ